MLVSEKLIEERHFRNKNLTGETYIRHKIHIFCWWTHTHGFLSREKSFLDTWFCRPARDILSLRTVYLCQHSHPRTSSLLQGETRHIQRAAADHYIDHVYHLQQIYRGSNCKYIHYTLCKCSCKQSSFHHYNNN